MEALQTLDPLGVDFDPGFAQEHIGKQSAAHANLAVNVGTIGERRVVLAMREKRAIL